jgi:hypothetical protein
MKAVHHRHRPQFNVTTFSPFCRPFLYLLLLSGPVLEAKMIWGKSCVQFLQPMLIDAINELTATSGAA